MLHIHFSLNSVTNQLESFLSQIFIVVFATSGICICCSLYSIAFVSYQRSKKKLIINYCFHYSIDPNRQLDGSIRLLCYDDAQYFRYIDANLFWEWNQSGKWSLHLLLIRIGLDRDATVNQKGHNHFRWTVDASECDSRFWLVSAYIGNVQSGTAKHRRSETRSLIYWIF